ncbi:MAG UNVERIFIED_CONTAM: hypothetical protein LVR18_08570 [Planctomycetaceae bacterium]
MNLPAALSGNLPEDAAAIAQSQRQAMEQLQQALEEAPQTPQIAALAERARTDMQAAAEILDATAKQPSTKPGSALPAEQRALQALLKMRAAEFQVQQQQQQQGGGGGGGGNRRLLNSNSSSWSLTIIAIVTNPNDKLNSSRKQTTRNANNFRCSIASRNSPDASKLSTNDSSNSNPNFEPLAPIRNVKNWNENSNDSATNNAKCSATSMNSTNACSKPTLNKTRNHAIAKISNNSSNKCRRLATMCSRPQKQWMMADSQKP